jgi:glycosyltransferase involved in cell wall biosynthesis
MERLGVLFLTNWVPVGGFETLLLSIVKEIDRQSFHPVLCCLKDGGPLEQEFRATGIPVYTRIQRSRLDPIGVHRLARIMRRERVQLLDTDLQRNTVLVGTLAATLARVPAAVISVHATARVGRRHLVEWPVRLCLGRIDRVIALAGAHRQLLVSQEHLDPSRVDVLWNGVDVQAFRPRTPKESLREDLGIPRESPVVAIIASLLPDKGHEVFLRAAEIIHARHPGTVFLVIGEGPERDKLESRARDMGLDPAVRFLGRRRDIADLLQIIDINVLCSYPYRETFPVSILEAMACGNPSVATRVGALSDIIAERETGFLVDVGDADGLAGSVNQLLDDPDLRRRMGDAARKRAVGLFDIKKVVREREALYRGLVEQKRGRRS